MKTAVLYLGNLSFSLKEPELTEFLSVLVGLERIEWVRNPITDEFKGFVFLYFQEIEHAVQAQEILHDFEFMERKLICSEKKNSMT